MNGHMAHARTTETMTTSVASPNIWFSSPMCGCHSEGKWVLFHDYIFMYVARNVLDNYDLTAWDDRQSLRSLGSVNTIAELVVGFHYIFSLFRPFCFLIILVNKPPKGAT